MVLVAGRNDSSRIQQLLGAESAPPEEVVSALRLGAADYINGPFTDELLLARIRSRLPAKAQVDSLETRIAAFPETGGSRFWLSLPEYQLDSNHADADLRVELTELFPVNSGETEPGSYNRGACDE